MATEIPPSVSAWVNARKSFREPVHVPGMYHNYAQSKSSACWGSRGGIDTGTGYRVAVCQPSPVDGSAPLFFDFIPIQL